MKDTAAYQQPPCAESLRQAIMDVWVTEITKEYCESLVSSMPCGIQVVIDSKGGHTKYRNVLTMTLIDVILFQIVL